jgi:hypothetical protein
MTSHTSSSFGPPLIGQTENALNAILARELEGTGLTEPRWVVLNLALAAGDGVARPDLASRAGSALKVPAADADTRIGELADAQLLAASGPEILVTEAGRTLHARIRGAILEITGRLWGDLPEDDLATAGRVLGTVLDRANAELTGV